MKRVQITARIPEKLRKRLDQVADDRMIARSVIVERAIEHYLTHELEELPS